MPAQQTFLERHSGADVIAVVKTYDAQYAKEAFDEIEEPALGTLAESLKLADLYDEKDIPSANDPDYPEFLWQTLLDESREDGAIQSFFVVYRKGKSVRKNLLVTPDWPTAQAFALRI